MKVRVKEGKTGFIYGIQRTENTEFSLKPVEHSTEKDDKGDPVIISVKQQFSKIWMEKVEKSSAKEEKPENPAKKTAKK